jgi:hypothetical protein
MGERREERGEEMEDRHLPPLSSLLSPLSYLLDLQRDFPSSFSR